MQTLWESQMPEADEEEDTGRKITGDDLARALREREEAMQRVAPGGAAPKAPSPMHD